MLANIKLHQMPSTALSFPTSLCQCPTLGTSCFPQDPTSPFMPPILVHFHVSPGLDVCPSVSAFAVLVLWVPSPRPGSQEQQKPSLWVEVRGCQPLLLLLDTYRDRAGYPRASFNVGGWRTLKRGSPLPAPLPSHNFPFPHFLHLPLPLPLSCLHSPNTHRLLSWVLSHHTQTHSLPRCPCPQPATGPAPQSPLLPWANESQMAACDSAMACGNPDVLPSHAPHPAPASPADGSNLLLWGWRLACLGLRIQTVLAITEGPSKLL